MDTKNCFDFLLFDFETSDLYNRKLPPAHPDQAWPVQVGAIYLDHNLNVVREVSEFVAPPHENAKISQGAYDTHGIDIEECFAKGISYTAMREIFEPFFQGIARPVGHNVWFDLQFVGRYAEKLVEASELEKIKKLSICTMRKTTAFCKLPPTKKMQAYSLKYKAPKLEELYKILFNKELTGAHDAFTDAQATLVCLRRLVELGVINVTS